MIWSLIAVPTVTILISSMGDTVVEWVKHGTLWLGQKTILPERQTKGKHQSWMQVEEDAEEEENAEEDQQQEDEQGLQLPEVGMEEKSRKDGDIKIRLSREIQKVGRDVGRKRKKRYGWEDWKRFLELLGDEEEGEEWRWLGDKGPLFGEEHEAEWVLGRLCERLVEIVEEMIEGENEKGI